MKRLVSLDVFRGFTIFAMLIVNNPGDWGNVYSFLKHAKWHGFTFADFVFPAFLFITGFSSVLSIENRKNNTSAIIAHILVRSTILFLIGLGLNGFPDYNPDKIRIMGVLQRIALVYLFISLVWLVNKKAIVPVSAGLLILYFVLLKYITAPDGGTGWNDTRSLNGWIDQLVLGTHIWKFSPDLDPEGILSTFPALVSGFSGMVAAGIYKNNLNTHLDLAKKYTLIGTGLIISGMIGNEFFPINKTIWSSSFVLFSSGLSLLLLSLFIYFMERFQLQFTYFQVFGMNSLAIYVTAGIVSRMIGTFKTGCGVYKTCIYNQIKSSIGPPELASLVFALLYLQLVFSIFYIFYKKKIIIKL